MVMVKVLASILFVVWAGGCGFRSVVKYTPFNAFDDGLKAPRKVEAVQIYDTRAPARKYVELGSISVIHESTRIDNEILDRIKTEAARHGCDGVVLSPKWGFQVEGTCIAFPIQRP